MRFAIDLPNFGRYSDPKVLAELARETEDSGWDGCFIWDHIHIGGSIPVANPWIALAAMAMATKRIRIGPIVTPLFRRQPWELARETVTLDHLSGGRLILGVGLGSDLFREISMFDGPTSGRLRAGMMEESLAIITGLWTGANFNFTGVHFRVADACFMPRPLQSPRIPIWVAGTWPKKPPLRRAARFDGVVAVAGDLQASLSPRQVSELASYLRQLRNTLSNFDIVQFGETSGSDKKQDGEIAAAYASAGATWWLESMFPRRDEIEGALTRIRQGPPTH